MIQLRTIAGLLLVSCTYWCAGQAPAVLSTGQWAKFSVTADGVVKIDYSLLRTAGFNPDQIDPRNIQIYTGQPGMLPQSNQENRKSDLTEIAIQVAGETDGSFNSNDYILFFTQGPDQYRFHPQKEIFEYENNLYSDKNFYFLTVGSQPGKRIVTNENVTGSFPLVQQFDDFAYYETDRYNLLKSGRHWFGEQFDANLSATIRFTIPNIVAGSQMHLISHVMAQSTNPSSFSVSINNIPVLTQPIEAVPNTTYGIKGRIKADTLIINATDVGAATGTNQEVRYQFTKGSSGLSIGYLDFFMLTMKRNLVISSDQMIFRSAQSLQSSVSTFEILAANSAYRVWNITNPDLVRDQTVTLESSRLRFSTDTQSLQTFIVFNQANAKAPVFEGNVPNQNLHNLVAPELLIITHPDFLTEASRLANHRTSHSNLTAAVVTTTQIFNEYGGGKQDVSAIRDFIRSLQKQNGSQLKNILLFGRGSYDYKNRVLGNTNYVPIYESRNSLSPLETYASDDYYAFLDDAEGNWSEIPAENHDLDVGVGRIPVKNLTEAQQVVDKLIDYDLNDKSYGSWQNEILFVADDGDFNTHNSQADQLTSIVDFLNPGFLTRKFFLDNYEQETRPSGQISPQATEALDRAIQRGSLIVNFTGHGSERVWMDERILDETLINNWRNGPAYPLLVTATCEFGRHDDPFQTSSGELTLLLKRNGSIGLVTSARPVGAFTNFTLNRAFYEALFIKENNQFRDLGAIFRDTKNNSSSGVANRNFSLLGDPSMKLRMPDHNVTFDEIKTTQGALSLTGLSEIKVSGQVERNGTLATDFSGELSFTLFDEETFNLTRGDENSPFGYLDRPNTLFRGKTSVNKGQFDFQFMMPRNISTSAVTGKIQAYAYDKSGVFANGSLLNGNVGGLNPNPSTDTTPPTIQLFLGDTTFINGGIVGPDTKLIAVLMDASGLNISANPSGHEIIATLDDEFEYVLNDYYSTDRDRSDKGSIAFPLRGLKSGKHSLTLTASDTYNNRTSSQVEFVVTEGDQIEIEEFTNYPNPFVENTTFEFTHTRPGEDLEIFLTIFDLSGKPVLQQTYEVASSQYRVTLALWDGTSASGTKLGQGVYVGKLSVRSLLDGSKNEQFTKLILLN